MRTSFAHRRPHRTLDRRLRFGLDPQIAGGANADKKCAALRIDRQRPVLMTLDDAEYAFLGDHLGAIGSGDRPSLLRRHLINALRLAAPRAESAENVRHAPDAVLVGYQDVTVPPGEAVGSVKILDVAFDPLRASAAVIAQQRQIAGVLFGDQTSPFGKTSSRRGWARPVTSGVAVKPGGTCGTCPS